MYRSQPQAEDATIKVSLVEQGGQMSHESHMLFVLLWSHLESTRPHVSIMFVLNERPLHIKRRKN